MYDWSKKRGGMDNCYLFTTKPGLILFIKTPKKRRFRFLSIII